MTVRRGIPLVAAAATLALAGCGGGDDDKGKDATSAAPVVKTVTTQGRTEVIRSTSNGKFDPAAIYHRESPSVVTIVSIFSGSSSDSLFGGGGGEAGQGSGFVISDSGEVATNAHVVTSGEGASIHKAQQVYVQFADGNQVEAKIVGFDPNADVALLKIDPDGLKLRALPLGDIGAVAVGEPVAAIGSPFGEAQSLSVGVVSALDRSIESLTGFQISGAVQTDAAINHGNSGGPLLDQDGRVIGINAQLPQGGSGNGEGVGFAVPVDIVKRSLDALRSDGRVRYAYLGVSSSNVYPQLAKRFDLGTNTGAWVQTVQDGPGKDAGLRAGSGAEQRFQYQRVKPGGDVIVALGGKPVKTSDDLGLLLEPYQPGQKVALTVVRDGKRKTIDVKLGERPASTR